MKKGDRMEYAKILEDIRNNIEKVIVGKREVIDLMLTALISSGHILLEDVPGVGKTTIAKALAKSCLLYTSDAADE